MSEIIQNIIKEQRNQDQILTQAVGHTLEITINRPQFHNAFTLGLYVMLQEAVQKGNNDPNVYIIMIKGNGKTFSSGNDLRNFDQWPQLSQDQKKEASKGLSQMLKNFTKVFIETKKPLIACCQGGVIGFIFPLLSVFDQVFITEDTYFFAPMLLFGQGVEMFSSYTFPRLFGQGKTFSLLFRGQKLTAQEAIQFGFAQEIFKTKEEMYSKTRQICQQLEQQDQISIQFGKQLITQTLLQNLNEANDRELQNLERIWSSEKLFDNVFSYMQRLKAKL